MTAKIFCVANQKGGVGKTTTTVNLAAYLAAANRKILVIDIDPQSNATSSLGVDPRSLPQSVYDVLVDQLPARDAIVATQHLGLDILPASPDLVGAEVELTRKLARERLLARALEPLLTVYDYILIDDPPSLGLLTINGLTAANSGVLIPVQCEYLALEGLTQLTSTISQVREVLNSQLQIWGVLLTMYDGRTNLGQQVVQEVQEHFAKQVFKTIIPRNIRLSEAPSYGQTILSYAPGSTGAQAYQALAQEMLERAEKASTARVKETQ